MTDGRTDGQTDGIAVANTALAMRALRRAVKTKLRPLLLVCFLHCINVIHRNDMQMSQGTSTAVDEYLQ